MIGAEMIRAEMISGYQTLSAIVETLCRYVRVRSQ